MNARTPFLSRNSLMAVTLFGAGALSVVGYGYVTRDDGSRGTPSAEAADQRSATAPLAETNERAGVAAPVSPAPLPSPTNDGASSAGETAALAPTPENVAAWIVQATGPDAAKRATAIDSLASAPKAEAVPVLATVLENGDESDRPRAMRSLRALAQRHGDADDHIRGVVRKIAFHSGDESAVQTAQAALQEIESDLSRASSAAVNR